MGNKIITFGKTVGPYVLAGIVLVTIAVTCAEPVKDGDFFWQMEYGRQMLVHRTLVPDHTLYSWTPATNSIIYCAWLGEMALYLMYKAGGLPLVFAFKYGCVLALLLTVWGLAVKLGQGKKVITFFVLLLVLLANHGATHLKPEIMSMVLMGLVGGLYFSAKASLWKKWETKAFLLFPLIFLVWVNTHGVFIFGLVLLGCITFGEILNFILKHKTALSKKSMGHLLTGAILSVMATLANPYGINYHVTLYHSYFSPIKGLRLGTVAAYTPSFDPRASGLHYAQFFLLMGIVLLFFLALFIWKKRSWDWAIIIPNLVLAWAATWYLRTFFYWPAFWGMSIIYFMYILDTHLPEVPAARHILNGLLVACLLFLAYRANYDSMYRQPSPRWCGFGIGYLSPVEASAFLKKYHPGKRLYNSYDIGGYLIHDLYPEYKVFCDPRQFPYSEWFDVYWNFNNGPTPLKTFMKKFDFDVAVVDYRSSESPILKFLESHDWEPVYYGPAAMVFVRKDVNFKRDIRKLDKHRFDDLKNLQQAVMVFNIAASLGDLSTSGYILDVIKRRFSALYDGYKSYIRNCGLEQEGLVAYAKGDYETSWQKLSQINADQVIFRVNLVLLQLRNWKCKQLVMQGKLREGLELIEATLRQQPLYVDGLYNAGILGYQMEALEIEKEEKNYPLIISRLQSIAKDNDPKWKDHLRLFLVLSHDHRYAWIAKQVLDGGGLPPNVPLAL
jgi:hypothetical protein